MPNFVWILRKIIFLKFFEKSQTKCVFQSYIEQKEFYAEVFYGNKKNES